MMLTSEENYAILLFLLITSTSGNLLQHFSLISQLQGRPQLSNHHFDHDEKETTKCCPPNTNLLIMPPLQESLNLYPNLLLCKSQPEKQLAQHQFNKILPLCLALQCTQQCRLQPLCKTYLQTSYSQLFQMILQILHHNKM